MRLGFTGVIRLESQGLCYSTNVGRGCEVVRPPSSVGARLTSPHSDRDSSLIRLHSPTPLHRKNREIKPVFAYQARSRQSLFSADEICPKSSEMTAPNPNGERFVKAPKAAGSASEGRYDATLPHTTMPSAATVDDEEQPVSARTSQIHQCYPLTTRYTRGLVGWKNLSKY